MKRVHYFLLVSLLGMSIATTRTEIPILSEAEDARQTFPFSVGAYAFYIPQGRFFVGAAEEIADNEYAIAGVSPFVSKPHPLAPALVTLNGQTSQVNPLTGACMRHMGMMGSRLLVVTENHPARLHAVDVGASMTVIQSPIMNNAHGEPAGTILKVVSSSPREEVVPEASSPTTGAFVALSNSEGSFDGNGSGIGLALLQLREVLDETTQVVSRKYEWALANAVTGEEGGNLAAPLGPDTRLIAINAPAAELVINDLFFDAELNRLYIGLTVATAEREEARARAVVVAYALGHKLYFQPIMPDEVLTQPAIHGASGALQTVSVNHVRTMHTTTRLRYLVTASGNSVERSGRFVHAVPLVDNHADEAHGTLAAVHQSPTDVFMETGRLRARVFAEAARAAEDVWRPEAVEALVGGGSAPGEINALEVIRDAVYVSTTGEATEANGLFCSRALFDVSGAIVGWTRWVRTGGPQEPLAGFAVDPSVGHLWHLSAHAKGIGRLLKRTTWGGNRIDALAHDEFSFDDGGVHGVSDFPYTTQGLSRIIGERFSCVALTGHSRVALIQTGLDAETGFKADESDLASEIFKSTDGTLAGFSGPVPMVLVHGGELDELGHISECVLASDGAFGWFVVAGAGGIAVLARADGTGFDAIEGLKKGFNGLADDFFFKKIGDIQGVRRLISFANELYVLTHKELLKLELTPEAIRSGSFRSTILAASEQIQFNTTFFSDVLVRPPLILLATSRGLFRSGNGVHTDRVQNQAGMHWTRMSLPETCGSFRGDGPITRFFSVEGHTHGVGNVYVLNAAVTAHQAHIYRLVVRSGEVTDKSVELFNDLFRVGKPTFYLSVGDYRNFIFTDGALFFASRSAYGEAEPLLELFPPYLLNSMRWGTRGSIRLPLELQGARSFRQLVRISATGSFMAYGDFGTRTLH